MKPVVGRWMRVGGTAGLLAFLLAAPLAFGQLGSFARLVGTVTDQSGGVIPGVEVTAVNKETNVASKTVTNERGDYIIDKIRPGTYDVSSEQPGFKKQLFAGVRLEIGQYGRVDFVLQTGQIAETVTVTGQSPIINTEKAEMGSVIEEKTIREMPLRGRDIVKLAFLTTGGVQETQEVGLLSSGGSYGYGGGTPAFNGQPAVQNQVTLDGSNATGYIYGRMNVSPTPETLQEFKLITNNYSAEYGSVAGARISLASKSGSNDFHGDAWYYFRNEGMDANRFFNNRTGRGKLPVDYRIFGGDFGGPIFKNKTFFYGNYEHVIDDLEATAFATVPSLKRRAGDFGTADGPYAQTQLYDPYNVVNGLRVAFPNNVIPASRFNAYSSKLMSVLPIPTPNVAGALANNFSYASVTSARTNKWSIRADHNLPGGATLFGRYNWQETPQRRHTGAIGAPGMPSGVYQQFEEPAGGYNIAGGWVKPFGSKVVSELNVAVWKSRWILSRSIDMENWEEKVGFDTASLYPVTLSDGTRGPGGMPRVSAAGYMAWGPGAVESPLGDWGLDARYSLAWRKGDHYFKFGFSSMRNRDVFYLYMPQGVGQSSFDGYATGQITRDANGNINGATFGDPFADFLLGANSNFAGNIRNPFGYGYPGGEGNFNQAQYSAFVQDEWKFSKNLSLSLGVRWEQPRPPFYQGNRTGTFKQDFFYCGIDYSKGRWNPTQMFPEGFDIKQWAGGDLTKTSIPYGNLNRRGCYDPRWSYFVPRLGLAWKMFGTNKTVLRIGGGGSIDTMIGVNRARTLGTNIGEVSLPQARGQAPVVSFGSFKALPTLAASAEYRSCYYSELDWREGTVYSYNMSIQHEIFNGTMVEVAYVGNQGRHLKIAFPHSMAMPEGYDKIVLQNGEKLTASSAAVTMPGSNVVFTGQRARRPYPQIIANVMYKPDGNTHYDSMQAKVERRFASGWALSSGYTWSKAMALNNNGTVGGNFDTVGGTRAFERNLLHGLQGHDRTNTFYSSFIWELPFFKSANGLTRTILGGWEVANITTLTSGQTFPVSVGVDILDLGSRGNSFPDRVREGALPKDQRTVDRFFDTSAFPCANAGCPNFVTKASYYGAGNSYMRPLRGAAVPLVDFSLHKKFQIRERQTFDFRVDMFNSFNHPVYQNPNGNIATANGGKVTDTASPRQIMFGFRYSF